MLLLPWRHVVLALAAGLIACVPGGVARATMILDQQTDPNAGRYIHAILTGNDPGQRRAETFTVGIAGTLAEVDVCLDAPPPAYGDLQLEIRPTAPNGLPADDGTYLLQITTPMSGLPYPFDFVAFDVSPFGVAVTPGEILAIVVSVQAGGSRLEWGGSFGNSYPQGAAFNEDIPNQFWDGHTGASPLYMDLNFRTFVEPIPEPGSWLLCMVGIVGLAGGIWRRRPRAVPATT